MGVNGAQMRPTVKDPEHISVSVSPGGHLTGLAALGLHAAFRVKVLQQKSLRVSSSSESREPLSLGMYALRSGPCLSLKPQFSPQVCVTISIRAFVPLVYYVS